MCQRKIKCVSRRGIPQEVDWAENMKVIPVNFHSEHKAMLEHKDDAFYFPN